MKATIVAALLLYTIQVNCWAEDTRRDGNWWGMQTEFAKVNYSIGFLDGTILGGKQFEAALFLAAPKFDPKLVEYAANVEKKVNELNSQLFTNVTVGQLRDGLNNFYSDYKNRRIYIFNAVFIVCRAISGASQDQIEQLSEKYRKEDSK